MAYVIDYLQPEFNCVIEDYTAFPVGLKNRMISPWRQELILLIKCILFCFSGDNEQTLVLEKEFQTANC